MYRIGDFSRITSLTVKALRYYDEEGLLKPSYRDKDNLYRYYDDKDVLLNYSNESDLAYFLNEKKGMIEGKIKRERELVKKINLYIKPEFAGGECMNMDYKVEIKEIPSVTVASIRFTGRYDSVGEYYGKIYRAVKGKSTGFPFNCYYDEEYKEEADIEICVPVSKGFSAPGVTVRTLPKIKAVCTLHKGPYEKLNLAYKAVLDYIEANGLKSSVPSREMYIKGPGMVFKGNPNNYETEIIIPVE